jgi:hypothetical protein
MTMKHCLLAWEKNTNYKDVDKVFRKISGMKQGEFFNKELVLLQ